MLLRKLIYFMGILITYQCLPSSKVNLDRDLRSSSYPVTGYTATTYPISSYHSDRSSFLKKDSQLLEILYKDRTVECGPFDIRKVRQYLTILRLGENDIDDLWNCLKWKQFHGDARKWLTSTGFRDSTKASGDEHYWSKEGDEPKPTSDEFVKRVIIKAVVIIVLLCVTLFLLYRL